MKFYCKEYPILSQFTRAGIIRFENGVFETDDLNLIEAIKATGNPDITWEEPNETVAHKTTSGGTVSKVVKK